MVKVGNQCLKSNYLMWSFYYQLNLKKCVVSYELNSLCMYFTTNKSTEARIMTDRIVSIQKHGVKMAIEVIWIRVNLTHQKTKSLLSLYTDCIRFNSSSKNNCYSWRFLSSKSNINTSTYQSSRHKKWRKRAPRSFSRAHTSRLYNIVHSDKGWWFISLLMFIMNKRKEFGKSLV